MGASVTQIESMGVQMESTLWKILMYIYLLVLCSAAHKIFEIYNKPFHSVGWQLMCYSAASGHI
jgi:hypothetical protein